MEGTQLFEMALGLSGGWKAVRSEFSVVQFSDSPGSAIRREPIRRAGRVSRGKALFPEGGKGVGRGASLLARLFRRARRYFSPRRLILAKRHFLCSVGSGCFADSDMFL